MEYLQLVTDNGKALDSTKIGVLLDGLDKLVNEKHCSPRKLLKINHFPFGAKGVEHSVLGYILGDDELFLETDKWGKKGIAYLTKDLQYVEVAEPLYKSLNFISNECIEVIDRDKSHFVFYKNNRGYKSTQATSVQVANVPPQTVKVDKTDYTVNVASLFFKDDKYFLGLLMDEDGFAIKAISGAQLKKFMATCFEDAEKEEEGKYPVLDKVKELGAL